MKFIGFGSVRITEKPAVGDIVEVDYTEYGILPESFREGGHKKGRYLCQVKKYGYSEEVLLAVLYDMTQNRPFSSKNKDLYIAPHRRGSREYYGTGSGAQASCSWLTRKDIDLMIDEYNRRKKR